MSHKSNATTLSSSEIRPHRDLPEFYPDRKHRAEFVFRLFDDTARHYDRISSALSFGTCKLYRKQALRRAGLQPGMRVLDVATGTGLAARAALDLGVAPKNLVGIDPSRGMLTENRKHHSAPLIQGRGEAICFASGTFDFICMGYALRHVDDLGVLFREFHRLLKPGGRILILEITRPASRWGFTLGHLYLNRLLPTLTRWITRNPDAGRLLQFYWATIAECVPPKTILDAIALSGFSQVQRTQTCRLFSDYSALKPID